MIIKACTKAIAASQNGQFQPTEDVSAARQYIMCVYMM